MRTEENNEAEPRAQMKTILAVLLLFMGLCSASAKPDKEDIISSEDLQSAGEWNPFDKKDPPLSFSDAEHFAQAYLKKTEKFGAGIWVYAPKKDPSQGNLVLAKPNLWFWRLDFVFAPSGFWSGPVPSRSVSVLMNGRCLSPYFNIKKNEPNQSPWPTDIINWP